MMQYTGAPDAVCPITLITLSEMHSPVAFRFAPHQPYECEALVKWLQESLTNPMTNLEVSWRLSALEVIGPLGPRAEFATSMLETKLPSTASKCLKDGWIWVYFIMLLYTLYDQQMVSNLIFIVYTSGHTWVIAKAKGRLIFASGAAVIVTGEHCFLDIIIIFSDFYIAALISFWILNAIINPFQFSAIVITAVKGIAHSVDLHFRLHRRRS